MALPPWLLGLLPAFLRRVLAGAAEGAVRGAIGAESGEHPRPAPLERTGRHDVQVAEVTAVDKLGSQWERLARERAEEREKAEAERDLALAAAATAEEHAAQVEGEHRGCLARVEALEQRVGEILEIVEALKAGLAEARALEREANASAELLRHERDERAKDLRDEQARHESTRTREHQALERAHRAELQLARLRLEHDDAVRSAADLEAQLERANVAPRAPHATPPEAPTGKADVRGLARKKEDQ